MKKILLIVIGLQLSLFFVSAHAVNYCAPQSWGYAGNVTGGGNATPTLVSSESQLKTALGKAGSVIIITQDITVSNHISSDKSDLTIMALPGKRLISNQQNQSNSGILYLKGNNIILRNLTFEGPGAYDCDGWDNLCLDKATNVWVDHCDFQDGVDGNFDIKSTSDNITVSWCRFRYLKEPKAGGSGGADDHRFSNLVGSGSSDKPADGTYNITYAFCWWDEGCKQRMTRCRNCLLHFLNCYWKSSVADYYVGPENASCYFEGCTFAGSANSASRIWRPFNNSTNYCQFVNCAGNLPSNSGSVSAPSYDYDALSAANAKKYVTNAECGAGATLAVTNGAEVSSSCGEEEQPEEPAGDDVVSESIFWNISSAEFNSLGTITSETTINKLHLMATSTSTMTVDANTKTIDARTFTHRLKLGGSGSKTSRNIWFRVKGSCFITVYLMSSSSSADRELALATGSFDNVCTQFPAVRDDIGSGVYFYTGDTTTIYLYSPSSGVNIYGIDVTYITTSLETPTETTPAHKLLHDGHVLIMREDKTYTISGQSL